MFGELFTKGQLSRLAKLLRRGNGVSEKLQQIFKAELPGQRRGEEGEGCSRIPVLYGQGKSAGWVGLFFGQAGQPDGWLLRFFPILPDDAVAAEL